MRRSSVSAIVGTGLGRVVAAGSRFRNWLLGRVREHTVLRVEQSRAAAFALVPDLDMAGARGAAIAARDALLDRSFPA